MFPRDRRNSGTSFRPVQARLDGTSDVADARNDMRSTPQAQASSTPPSGVPETSRVRSPPLRHQLPLVAAQPIIEQGREREGRSRQTASGVIPLRRDDGNDEIQPNRLGRESAFAFQPSRRRRGALPPNTTHAEAPQHYNAARENDRSEERFIELREALLKANENYNEKKAMLSNALKDIDRLEMNNHALITMYNRLEQERNDLQLENRSLRSLNTIHLEKKNPKGKFSSDLPVMFHGIASNISRNILGWCDRETKELIVTGEEIRRNWLQRSEKTRSEGISISADATIVPTSPIKLSDRRQYYTPSFQNEKEMLIKLVDEEMASSTWVSHFPTETHKEECRKAIRDDIQLKAQIKQTISDRLSARKRNARDKLFMLLGYFLLLSRKPKTQNTHELNERQSQKKEIEDKFVVKDHIVGDQEVYDFSVWRTEDMTKLACSTYEVTDSAEEITGDVLFKHKFSLHVLHEFRGHGVEDNPDLLSSILTLARLDSWIMTLAVCLSLEEGRGGKRQKLFNGMYYKFLPMATMQLIERVCYIVWKEKSEELLIRCSANDRRDDPFENDRRISTKVFESTTDECFYIAVRPDWFQANITKNLGNVCDCYIGEGKRDGKLFHLHGMEAAEGTEYAADTEGATDVANSSNAHFARYRQ